MSDLLSISNLQTRFRTRAGKVHAVNGVSFALNDGEVLGIVGESGCGKSVTMLSLLRLVPRPPGEVSADQAIFNGQDLMKISNEEMRRVRGSQIAMIFQDPMTSLNPVLPVGYQVAEPLVVHKNMPRKAAQKFAVELLARVGIPDAKSRVNDFPHQLSGGMRQRAMIAMSLACSPQVIIADEPTTALDVTIQAQIVDLVRKMQEQLGIAAIWITHDLGIVAGLAQRVLVMYAGFVIEEALVDELFERPQHPYTIGLLGSLPRLDEKGYRRLVSIDGSPPVLMQKPTGCPFFPRCKVAQQLCLEHNPVLKTVEGTHRVACWIDPHTGRERK